MGPMSARLQKVIKGPFREEETDITSESDTRILNSAQKRFQVLYCVFCETYVNNTTCWGDYVI